MVCVGVSRVCVCDSAESERACMCVGVSSECECESAESEHACICVGVCSGCGGGMPLARSECVK